jgi:hypothetical protein
MTYRVLVSTDLGGDPDDIQSLYRLIHYSDVLKIEGITSCTGPGSQPSADLIRHWIHRVDVEHLRANGHTELMTEEDLLDSVVQGTITAGAPGPGKGTEGSRKIDERAKVDSAEILWIPVWGSITDVAQALYDAPEIAPRIRINYIGSSNTEKDPKARDWVYRFMAEQCPDLWWIENGVLPKLSRDTFRGVYQTGVQDAEWGNIAFIEQNIRGRGSNHDGMFDEVCGDAFPVAGWPQGSLKEGDSPTLLHLLSPVFGGVGDVDDPTSESWGGQYAKPEPERFPNYYTDLDADAETCQKTISKWRKDFLGHWKDRWKRYGQ